MSDKSAIEWTDATWPIVQGCDPVSEGCVHCYAVKLLWRMMHHPDPKISGPLQGLVEKYVNAAGEEILRFTGKLALREDRLDWPLKWKTPRMIFVPSHGDLFHKGVPDAFIDKVFAVMALCPQHTFQVLTKRAERMRDYLSWDRVLKVATATDGDWPGWPLPNVWLGVSAERQQEADERIPLLLQTPAAVRFVSAEPLLGPIDLTCFRRDPSEVDLQLTGRERVEGYWFDALKGTRGVLMRDGDVLEVPEEIDRHPSLDWIIVGGESGKNARPMHPQWARSLRDQCSVAGVSFFFKQWGEWGYFGRDLAFREMNARDSLTWGLQHESGPLPFGQYRVGKKAAGRLLDGKEHNEFPSHGVAA